MNVRRRLIVCGVCGRANSPHVSACLCGRAVPRVSENAAEVPRPSPTPDAAGVDVARAVGDALAKVPPPILLAGAAGALLGVWLGAKMTARLAPGSKPAAPPEVRP
jgi:hypothetical protein